ncbi:MAG: imidazole glycerol phosphate synthase subunit HisH [Actinobacteria bacterium]|nr:MAG: imidazole glycerol phosphate synthase subunit HisH [Actinomycetota bacterium]
MIAVIDYKMGNLRSVQKAFEHIGLEAVLTGDPAVVGEADAVVLPGVGAFEQCMENLTASGTIEPMLAQIEAGTPFLGICLGLQLLLSRSYEGGRHEGLGLIEGEVLRLPERVKVPHMGWNQVRYRPDCPIFAGIEQGTNFYFVHSYYTRPADASVSAATVDYGLTFDCAIWRDNLFAVQFHPEKSGRHGLKMLENFGRLVA